MRTADAGPTNRNMTPAEGVLSEVAIAQREFTEREVHLVPVDARRVRRREAEAHAAPSRTCHSLERGGGVGHLRGPLRRAVTHPR